MKRTMLVSAVVLALLVPALMWATGAQESSAGTPKELPKVTIFNNRPARTAIPEGLDFTNNPYINYIREKSGVDPVYLRPENSTYYDKLTLIMASGQMPDIVQGQFSHLYKYAAEKLIIPLDDLLKKHGQDMLKNMPPNAWKHVSVGGKIYAMPGMYFYPVPGKDSIPNRLLWVRRDWMNKLNLKDPVTLDEYTDLLRKFKNNDPDGNGKADTLGYSAYMTGGDLMAMDPLFGAFGVIPNGGQWSDVNGRVEYNPVRPQMKSALKYLNGLFTEGLLDPEFYLNNQNKMMEKVYQGKLGTWLGSWWEPQGRTESIIKNTSVPNLPGGLIKAIYDPTGPGGQRGNSATLAMAEGVYFITADCKDPATAMKFLNWRFSPTGIDYDFGFEGENFTRVNGVRVRNQKSLPAAYARAYHTSYDVWSEADFRQYVVDYTGGDPDMFAIAWRALEVSAEDGVTSAIPYYQSPSLVEYGPELQKLWIEYAVKIITGQLALDKFDEFVEKWKKSGGDEITREMNEFYKNQ